MSSRNFVQSGGGGWVGGGQLSQGPRVEGLGAQDGLVRTESGPLLIQGASEPWVN